MRGVLSQIGRLFAGVSFATSNKNHLLFLSSSVWHCSWLHFWEINNIKINIYINISNIIIIIEYENTRESSQGSYIEGLVLDNYSVSLKITSR